MQELPQHRSIASSTRGSRCSRMPAAVAGSARKTQDKPVFERCEQRPHSGRWAAKLVCRTGDVYARWVYRAPDLFASVNRGDRLKLSFWYRASAALGDALVQVNHDAAPGWRAVSAQTAQGDRRRVDSATRRCSPWTSIQPAAARSSCAARRIGRAIRWCISTMSRWRSSGTRSRGGMRWCWATPRWA